MAVAFDFKSSYANIFGNGIDNAFQSLEIHDYFKAKKLFYKNLVEAEKQVKLKETPSDLSFKRFWDTYDVKASKRKQSMNIWDKMTDTDKILCLLYIPRYNFIKVNDNTTKMYANTFLNQKGWL